MRISAKSLINYQNANSFVQANQWTIRSGELNILNFQLVDLDQANLRYMAGCGSSNTPTVVFVSFPSIDDSKVLTVQAVQSACDKSIWSVTLSAIQMPNSGNVQFALTEGAVTRRFSVVNMLSVEFPKNDGSC